MEEDNKTSKQLETEKIGKLLFEYSLPAIIAMTTSSLYNIIDRIFIGNGIGPMAISGLAITFPLMNLAAAFGSLVGAGASAIASIRLGQKKWQDATHTLGNALILNLIIGLIFTVIGLVFMDEILILFGATPATLPYAKDFMTVILYGNVITHVYIGLNNIMRATGHPRKAMITAFISVGINIILAPLFIYQFKWGIKGAATATILSQIIGLIWVLNHFFNKKTYIRFRRGYFHLDKKITFGIFSIGMAPFCMNLCSSAIAIIINMQLQKYGKELAIGAFGIINSLATFVVMILFGLNQGMQPIVGYNYGARQNNRVLKTLKYTFITGFCIVTFSYIIFQCFPYKIASFFTDDAELIAITANGIHYNLIAFPIVTFQIIAASFFQSIGKAANAIILSLSRQMFFLIPLLFITPNFWGLNGVWLASPCSDFMAMLLTFILLGHQIKVIHKFDKEHHLA